MNAYELADLLEKQQEMPRTVQMLRQQADRIAELEKFIKAILKKGGCDGNICKRYDTHPVKQLSDEEITQIALKTGLIVEEQLTEDYAHDYVAEQIEFARAIIKEITE